MAIAYIKEIKDRRTIQERARAAIEVYTNMAVKPSSAGQISVRKGQYLDVDGILARSLPATLSQSPSAKP